MFYQISDGTDVKLSLILQTQYNKYYCLLFYTITTKF